MTIKLEKTKLAFTCKRCSKVVDRDTEYFCKIVNKQVRINSRSIHKLFRIKYCYDCGKKIKKQKMHITAKTRYEYISEG